MANGQSRKDPGYPGCQPMMATKADAKGYVGLGMSEANIAMGLHDIVDNY
jgi:hypothetical protein